MRIVPGFAALLLAVAWSAAVSANAQDRAAAVFAGGCFWCIEPPYDALDGVHSTTSGYIGGDVTNPTYRQVTSGTTGHFEAVRVEYDPAQVSYGELLEVFWRNVDPLDGGGQFCDRGDQYRAALFPLDEEQRRLAEASLEGVSERLGEDVATTIEPAAEFYPAEDYHQDYYMKNPVRYKFYRYSCGRDARLAELWGEAGGS